MKIIFLTNSNIEKNGWSIISRNIFQQLKQNNEICLFTSDKKSILNFSRHSIVAERYLRGSFFLIFDFIKIYFLTLRFKPDIIHCNTEYFAPIALLLSKYFKVPFTVSVAGTYGITLPKQYKMYSNSFKRASSLICLSNYKSTISEKILYCGYLKNHTTVSELLVNFILKKLLEPSVILTKLSFFDISTGEASHFGPALFISISINIFNVNIFLYY